MQRTKKPQSQSSVKDVVEQVEASAKKPTRVIAQEGSDTYIPTGPDVLDLMLGGGGMQVGKMVNIIGDKSSGKSLLASEIIAAAFKKYGAKRLKWRYDDAEAGYSFDSKRLYGLQIVDPDFTPSYTIEDFRRNLDNELRKLREGQLLIYVLDCFDSLTTDAEVKHSKKKQKASEDGTDAKGSYGTSKAKEMSEFFRLMRKDIKDKNCLLIIISQVRENIGVMFGEKYTRSGGKALDFYASILLWLAEVEKLYRRKTPAGVSIKARSKKNKQSKGNPFRECFFQMWFDYGVDNILSSLHYLYDLYTDKGKLKTGKEDEDGGATVKKIKWDGKEMTVEHAIKYIELRNQEDVLLEKITKKWDDFQASIATKGRKPRYE